MLMAGWVNGLSSQLTEAQAATTDARRNINTLPYDDDDAPCTRHGCTRRGRGHHVIGSMRAMPHDL